MNTTEFEAEIKSLFTSPCNVSVSALKSFVCDLMGKVTVGDPDSYTFHISYKAKGQPTWAVDAPGGMCYVGETAREAVQLLIETKTDAQAKLITDLKALQLSDTVDKNKFLAEICEVLSVLPEDIEFVQYDHQYAASIPLDANANHTLWVTYDRSDKEWAVEHEHLNKSFKVSFETYLKSQQEWVEYQSELLAFIRINVQQKGDSND